eukprot:scaffold918_cov126-Cylindrotheca_fusiformis.AAC.62
MPSKTPWVLFQTRLESFRPRHRPRNLTGYGTVQKLVGRAVGGSWPEIHGVSSTSQFGEHNDPAKANWTLKQSGESFRGLKVQGWQLARQTNVYLISAYQFTT